MRTFEIKEDFLLDGKPIKLISGAIHYFRMTPAQWTDSLYNLKALGANTVETYIPWNLHEPREGVYDFEGMKDICAFVKQAQTLGLMVILRPSVYICAEWEFGGLPAWLLNEPMRLRSTDPRFMAKVRNYFQVLLPKLVPLQITHGGPVIMMQVENEYGSYGMEKAYLRQTKELMEEYGIDVPLFTSDGAWEEVLDAGTLIEDDIFVTGNFGSRSKENAAVMKEFMAKHGKNWPIMCMEYWDGWFNRWGEPIIKRDGQDLANEVKEMLAVGSLNLYMFHGGTNFGFYNGCSARGALDLPQVSSYDYDALLTEAGEPTDKYYHVQKAIKEACPEVWQAKPRTKQLAALGTFPIENSVSLLAIKDQLMAPQENMYPLTMEAASTGYGYLLYSVQLKNYHRENKLKVVEASDRLHIFTDGQLQAIQYQETLGEELLIQGTPDKETIELDVLVENLGRVNYGFKLNGPTQAKGIRGGIMQDIHFHQGYRHYPLMLSAEQLQAIDYQAGKNPTHPSFYQTTFRLTEVGDTFIDCRGYGKGVVIVNGINLGRYWQRGPVHSLYCPKEFLKKGSNEVVVFETDGVEIKELVFCDQPVVE
ncbi:glycosyl hydrolase family 35 [Enterococcus casseliflavus ATCC 12755]|uniref:Beta-galactosidase n=1 Tax=Enterococcus casseliflavus ATCC 12755 TaxID=888066 RepID=F0EGS3_ENTCA|nr:beta-galactosidase family protein [Enterococcus casseliflavus]EGC70993.1 glycosyl hydrolase family 35 [Enterococcus casseliflavus ATCC 12755]